ILAVAAVRRLVTARAFRGRLRGAGLVASHRVRADHPGALFTARRGVERVAAGVRLLVRTDGPFDQACAAVRGWRRGAADRSGHRDEGDVGRGMVEADARLVAVVDDPGEVTRDEAVALLVRDAGAASRAAVQAREELGADL